MTGNCDMKILHIHSDYPDGRNDLSTPAVRSLLDATTGVQHTVFVIHRTPFPWQVKIIEHNNHLFSIYYWGLPFGLALEISLYYARNTILKLIQRQATHYKLIHSHKLAIDGTLGADLSKLLGIPYFLSVRGGTDMRIIRHKKFMRYRWKNVLEGAKHIFWVSSWAQEPIKKLLKTTVDQSSLLPNPCEMSQLRKPKKQIKPANFVTVFRFEQYDRKGIIPLIEAINLLRHKYPEVRLDIYGSGPKSKMEIVQSKISVLSLDKHVAIKGRIENNQLQEKLQDYSAFLLPSKNESFGMVFVEALFSGLPILYHANTGIDGYLDGIDVGVKVNNQSPDELADKVERLITQHDFFHDQVSLALESHVFDLFEKNTVVNHYQSLIDDVNEE